MKYDVIVVGAGPGGSMAAKTAAEAGLDVLLLEKRQEIGVPVRCAEGVSIRSELEQIIKLDPSWISTEIKGIRLYSPNSITLLISENGEEEGGYVLERKLFDRGLAIEASRAGAKVLVKTRAVQLIKENGRSCGVEVICMGDPISIEAPLIIGADGIESKVGRWAGIDAFLKSEDIMVCAQFLVTDPCIDDDYCEFFFGNAIAPGGYLWIFPKGEKLANVGIGIQASQCSSGDPVRLLHRFLENRMPKARILQMIAGGIPTSGPMKTTTSDGIMLVGDAARQTDPLTGGGILNAMRAGSIAGRVAAKAVSSGDVSKAALMEYEERCRSCFGKQLEKGYDAKKFFLTLTDDDMNRLAASLREQDISRMSTPDLLKVLLKQNPKMLWNLRHLLI